jgi:two-component system, NtrC family, sensor histidine kinase KinB
MTLKKNILMGYGVVFALLSIVIIWAIVNILSLRDATDAILSENYRSILAAKNMAESLEAQESRIYMLLSDAAAVGEMQEELRAEDLVFIQWLARAKDNITIDGEQDLVNSIEQTYSEYRELVFSAMSTQGITSPASGDVLRLSSAVRSTCNQLYAMNEKVMYAARDRAGSVAARAVWSTSVIAAAALILALVFSLFLAERLVKPLRQFIEASRIISAGDYTVSVPVRTPDELGLLAGEFNQMVSKLQRYHELNIEQILSEKRKGEAILASIEDGMIVFDPVLAVTGINAAARTLFGLEFSDYSALHCDDFISDKRICGIIQQAIETGKKPEVADEDRILIISKEDITRHFLFSVTSIRGKDGQISGVVLLLRDVTHLKEVERMKSEFIMAASHELRTPLTSLGMSIELIRNQIASDLAPREKELLQVACEEIDRMKNLVHELLDLSRLEAGSIELDFERVSVISLFTHVSEIFSGQLDMKKVVLSVSAPNSDIEVEVDANKITWVLSNLVSNALRYVSQGGQIVLSSWRDNLNAYFSVRDNGPGIPLEYQGKIFQKFMQVSKDKNSGSGLGLAICKEIIRAHGGAIWVDSAEGSGSTFTFMLPVERRYG